MKSIQDQQLAAANSMYTMPPSLTYEYPTFMETNTFSGKYIYTTTTKESINTFFCIARTNVGE